MAMPVATSSKHPTLGARDQWVPHLRRALCAGILLAALPLHADVYTAVGAEQAGNATQTIPPFEDAPITIPRGWRRGAHYVDPFPQDAPLFHIDTANLEAHQEKLSPGQKTLLRQRPARSLAIYPTRRTARYPAFILRGTRENATNARLTESGTGLEGAVQGFPFPQLTNHAPDAALQTLWNHMTRYRGGSVARTVMQTSVFDNGDFVPVKLLQKFSRAEHLSDYDPQQAGHVLFYYLDEIVSPARLAGNTLLVHETLDKRAAHRRAWIFNHALKRVRRAPGAAYDTPIPGTYDLKTTDSHDMFNGAPDKYDWHYEGKQELYIPYNAYALCSPALRYRDLLQADGITPAQMRWELHRVHKIVGTLKPGERHIYGQRVFYVDEDSWSIVLAESYDGKGRLWRVAEGHLIQYYDRDLPFYAMEVIYDLIDRRYLVFGLSNEESGAYSFEKTFSSGDFTPAALRRGARG